MKIKLIDHEAILPQVLVVHCSKNPQEFDIRQIELYADDACTILITDDVRFEELPQASQLSIYGKLHDWDHERMERRLRETRELAAIMEGT